MTLQLSVAMAALSVAMIVVSTAAFYIVYARLVACAEQELSGNSGSTRTGW